MTMLSSSLSKQTLRLLLLLVLLIHVSSRGATAAASSAITLPSSNSMLIGIRSYLNKTTARQRRCNHRNQCHQQQQLWTLRGGASATTIARPKATQQPPTKKKGAQKNGKKKNKSNRTTTLETTASSSSSSLSSLPSISVPMLIRILFLCYYASLGSLMPYLPVYYHSLGHGGLIIGMLGAVKPLTTFLVAPFWGILSDTAGNKFGILYSSFVTSLVGQLLVAVRTDVAFLTIMVFVTAIFNAPVKSLIDSIVLDHLPNKADYGRMRLWGQLGFGIGSSCAGILLSKSKVGGEAVDASMLDLSQVPALLRPVVSTLHTLWMGVHGYRLLFVSYAALSIPTWWALRVFERMDKEKALADAFKSKERRIRRQKTTGTKGESTKIWQGLQLLVTNSDAMLFFFLVFVVGTSSGLIENFAYVRMREVGGTGKEMGLSRLVSSAAGAPMFWCSGPLTERWGADRVLVMALLSYVFRFFLYAAMRNPYHGLPAEALRGVTFAAFWSTGTIYAHRISPPGMSTTMLMFLNAMYGGLGQSMGAIIGGKLQSMVGTVQTFIYAGIFDLCFVGVVVLYMMQKKGSSFRNPKPIMPVSATNRNGGASDKERQR